VTDFDAQYKSLISEIKTDIAVATGLAVRVTPTFFINGIKVEGGCRSSISSWRSRWN